MTNLPLTFRRLEDIILQQKKESEKKDFTASLLQGDGDNDYEKYMRTDSLLSLQREKCEWIYRDELLFQITHQSTELWLKLQNEELAEAAIQLSAGHLAKATVLVRRAMECIKLITQQLEILTFMTPCDFLKIRPALGNGSGMESPGWRNVNINAKKLAKAFSDYVREQQIELIDIYTLKTHGEFYNLCESLINWDEKVAMWRMRHYKVAVRTIGHGSIGTKGTPVDKLIQRLNMKYFTELWEVRTKLTEISSGY